MKNVSLPFDPPDEFSKAGQQPAPETWWTVFEDDDLDTLVHRALRSNFNVLTAWQRLAEARAVLDRESSAFFPDIEALLQGEIREPEIPESEPLQLGLSARYEVDLWGRIRSRVQADKYRAAASQADLQTVALTLSAQVVRTWFHIIETRSEVDLLNQQVDTNEKVLQSLQTRFGSGQIRSVDILRQRQLLEATQEQRLVAESRLQVLEHQLAVLLGQPPQTDIRITPHSLPELPPLPETGVPLDLVRRRPDVQRAFNNLLAADRDLAAAISNQYPRLSLRASLTASGDDADNLFENWLRSFSGNLLAPFFYGGRLRAEVNRNQAVKNQRLYEYGQTTLIAFREVEDALIREAKQIERINSLRDQLDLVQQTYEQLRIEYFNGVANYLDVLTALISEQRLRRDLLAAELLLLEFRISLYRALAGEVPVEIEAEGDGETILNTNIGGGNNAQ